MKVVFLLALFALAFAFAYAADADACDPDGNGQPDCAGQNSGIHRNNWDPTRYWECQNGAVVVVPCPSQTGFLASAGGCVPWKDWEWVPPCPVSQSS